MLILTSWSRITLHPAKRNKEKQHPKCTGGSIFFFFFNSSCYFLSKFKLWIFDKGHHENYFPSLWSVIYAGYHTVNNEMMLCIVLFLWVIKGRALALSCHCKWSWISDVSLQLMLMRKRILRQNLLLAQHTRRKPHRIPEGGGWKQANL